MTHDCFVFVLGPTLGVARGPQWPLDCVEINGQKFHQTGAGDSTGFYDWLRDERGELIGVRYWPFERTSFLRDALTHLDYIRARTSDVVEIFLGSTRQIDESRSQDQAFQYSALFCSELGGHALLFGSEDLTDRDVARLALVGKDNRAATCNEDRTFTSAPRNR